MSNTKKSSIFETEPFEDRVDNLFRELELAIKWQRPSVLYAIYKSDYVRDEVETMLGMRFEGTGQKLIGLHIQSDSHSDLVSAFKELDDLDDSIVIVKGLSNVLNCAEQAGTNSPGFKEEFFVDNNIRVVFWLTDEEAVSLARTAPDYWSFRHRAIDFTDDPTPEQMIKTALEKVWEEAEGSESNQFINEIIGHGGSIPEDLPTSNETVSLYGNLLLKLGILHWRKQDYERANEYLQIALDIAYVTHDNLFGAECLYAIALVNTGLGREVEAIYAYESALDLDPGQKLPWNTLGHLYAKLGRNAEAHNAFQQAIEENPKDPISWNGLGYILSKVERFDDAIAAFQRAIEFAPNFVHPWNGLGDVYTTTGHVNEAITAYENAIRLNNRLPNPWIRLGNIFLNQQRIPDAIQAFRKATEIDEKSFHAWNDLGDSYLKAESFDEAIEAYSKAIDLAPNFGWPYRNLASAYFSKGHFTEAVPLLLKSIDLLRSNAEKAISFNKLGDAYRQLGDYQQALEAYQQADVLSNSTPDSLRPISEAPAGSAEDATPVDPVDRPVADSHPEAIEAPQAEAAAAVMQEAELETSTRLAALVEETPAEREIDEERFLAETRWMSPGIPAATEAVAEATTQVAEENPDIIKSAFEWNGVGNAYLKAGSYDEAISAYTRAIEVSPTIHWPYIHNLALAHYQKGRYANLSKPGVVIESLDCSEPKNEQTKQESKTTPWQGTTQKPNTRNQTRNTRNRPNPNYLLARARYLLASNSRG